MSISYTLIILSGCGGFFLGVMFCLLMSALSSDAPTRPVSTGEDHAVGKWLSAALGDPDVCTEMKADIRAWFDQFREDEL